MKKKSKNRTYMSIFIQRVETSTGQEVISNWMNPKLGNNWTKKKKLHNN